MQAFPKKDWTTIRQGQHDAPGISIIKRLCFHLFIFIAVLFLAAWQFLPVAAQDAATLTVQPPDSTSFPNMSVEFKLLNANNQPIEDLQLGQLAVVENEQSVPVTSLNQDYRGVLFTLAINANRELDLRDAAGVSRYEKLIDVLRNWASHRTFKGKDALSVVTNEGTRIKHTTTPRDWITALESYQPHFRLLEPNVTSLESAIQTMREVVVPFGVDKALLYITPPPTPEQIAAVNALAEVARSAGIRVDVWMVGEALFLANEQGSALVALAANTGGQFFHYTGVEAIPDPESALSALGYAHILTYTSEIRASGSYPLEMRATLTGLEVSSQSQPFYIEVLPPNPMLLSPPATVTREPIAGEQDDAGALTPAVVPLSIMIEFPDHHPREIVASRLIVDGVAVEVINAPPFTAFSWDISSLNESGEHTIQVEVEDELGLSAATLLTPVQVEVIQPETHSRLSWQQIGLIAAGGIAAAAVIILAVWISRRLWQTRQVKHIRNRFFKAGMDPSASRDKMDSSEKVVYAILLPIHTVRNGDEDPGIKITKDRVIVGSDPERADILLEDTGMIGVQAELVRQGGTFWLKDLDPERGTWLNYKKIGTERVRIKAGDLIHFGNSGFRFTIGDRLSAQKGTVVKYDPIL